MQIFNRMNKLLLSLAVLLTTSLSAQHERLTPLYGNAVLKDYVSNLPANANKFMSLVDTVDLPFLDDFSYGGVYPTENLWADKDVFVNNQFPRNPITIGVATFDGLDEYGQPYDNSASTIQGGCDTLTSKYIRLFTRPSSQGGGQYTLADSITLSFYWQKKGWGDGPDSNDSLVLDFYNFNTNQWSRQWFLKGIISGGQDTMFTSVQIRISNAAFLTDGFRFRFRTYGSRTGSLDHWHLDYVRLFKAYNQFTGQMDTLLQDVAMTKPAGSLMNEYTSVPWDHFISLSSIDQENLLKDSSKMDYRVNGNAPSDVGFNNRIYNYAGTLVAGFGADNGNIFPNRPQEQNLVYNFGVDSIYPNAPAMDDDSTFFTVKNYFTNGNAFSGLKTNDTTTYKQDFYNYYSFDDGTAEVGYDLINAPNGKVAMKFDILKPDTLRAVRIFFVQQGADVSTKYFSIKIWSSLNPETVIYQESGLRPAYINELNGFANYVLTGILPVSGTIYVGFQQVLGDGLHLGFDRNTASNSRMFYNIGAGWVPTAITSGSFMIRAVMGDSNLFVGVPEQNLEVATFTLFPNPSSDVVSISSNRENEFVRYEIMSIDGRLVRSEAFTPKMSTANLPPGLYIVRVLMANKQSVQQKLVISR
jgi:Secretion system C-terminal sorting domain